MGKVKRCIERLPVLIVLGLWAWRWRAPAWACYPLDDGLLMGLIVR